MSYIKSDSEYFAVTENLDEFYDVILQKVRGGWNRIGNEILGLSDSKVSRVLTGKQKDFDTIQKMAGLMQMKIEFRASYRVLKSKKLN